MPPNLSSQGVVLATAMAAVSAGTVILLAISQQKLFPHAQFALPRSCISSDGKKRNKKKKKKVQFADDVVEPSGNSEDFRKKHRLIISSSSSLDEGDDKNRGMPENRAALYNGMLRERVVYRLAYSY